MGMHARFFDGKLLIKRSWSSRSFFASFGENTLTPLGFLFGPALATLTTFNIRPPNLARSVAIAADSLLYILSKSINLQALLSNVSLIMSIIVGRPKKVWSDRFIAVGNSLLQTAIAEKRQIVTAVEHQSVLLRARDVNPPAATHAVPYTVPRFSNKKEILALQFRDTKKNKGNDPG